MKIGMAGPITLSLLNELLPDCPTLPPGYAFTQSAFMAAELVNMGHPVAIFALDPERTSVAAYSGPGWEIHIVPYRARARDRAKDLFRVERRALVHAMRSANCDVMHASWSYEFAWAALASGVPTLTTFHDWAPTILRLHRDPYRAARLLMAIRTLASRTRFTAVSPYIASRIRRYTRTSPPVIPNFVPRSWLAKDATGIARSPGRIIAVNNGWDDVKNVATLLRAIPYVRARLPEAHLMLVGHGYEPSGPAERWARARSLNYGVEFHGPTPNTRIADLMARAEVFAHPAREESFGIALIEAMTSGLPVIAGKRSGGVPWVLNDGQAGVLTDIRDPAALAISIVGLLVNSDRRASLARAGLENVRTRFSTEVVMDAYLNEYRDLTRVASHG